MDVNVYTCVLNDGLLWDVHCVQSHLGLLYEQLLLILSVGIGGNYYKPYQLQNE